MASNPSQKCCFEAITHEGEAKGKYIDLYGVKTYVTGETSSDDKVLVFFTDYFGNSMINNLLVADHFAKSGYKVYMPDILLGDVVTVESLETLDLKAWLSRHTEELVKPVVDNFMTAFKKEKNPNFLAVVGYCFGAKYAIQQINEKTGDADVAAIAHPSFVTIEEVAAIGRNPLLISAAEVDPVFSSEMRHITEDKLKEMGARYQLDLFSGVTHGFAVRGDLSDPVVKYAKEKVLFDQVYWFDHFANSISK